MTGITQEYYVTLFLLVVEYIDVKQQETYQKLKNRG